MLYELASPLLHLMAHSRRLIDAAQGKRRSIAAVERPQAQFRSAKARLRRLDVHLATAVMPMAGAWLALHRFERTTGPTPNAVPLASAGALVPMGKGTLALHFAGPLEGPRVLVVHGWSASSAMVLPLVQALSEAGFRVVYPDLPGEGRSVSAPMSFHEKGRMIALHCAQHGPFDSVIGHSAGGLIAAIALEAGLNANKLVTVCAPKSLTSLLQAYLVQTDAPRRLHDGISKIYSLVYRQSPCHMGPQTFARLQANLLVVHAKHDWQVLVDEAHAILSSNPAAGALFLDNCNHRSILHHAGLLQGIVAFLGKPSDPGQEQPC
ncbi:alpha/beta fold hydrolase [Agrobacterium rosae]|uniref:Alpha/beta fold hydrolase n=1 Tax=Agrobacterium rosae TaxID=1972867 RepID=A0AAW9FM97_9HYPH|nr:alpha/beta fold hydrolase [Agrobacterium rosae]MDX8305543.1 alpha/beta fold hydrolase [Agrobacterium rosae]